MQWIVEIKSSDVGFQTDEDCGIWYNTPREGSQSSIRPGMWLIGSQISPGRYRASTQSGCYWERLKALDGRKASILSSGDASRGGYGRLVVTAKDVALRMVGDCVWVKL